MFTALMVGVLGLGLAPSGAVAETSSAIRPVRQCAELVRDFDIPGATTHVTAARVVAASAGEPEHCISVAAPMGAGRHCCCWPMAHCVGGYPLTEFDPLRELVSWVERGTPPDRIIATARDAQGTVLRSRPVFPYPLRASYDGTGSIDDANNFAPAAPLLPPHDTIRWVSADLYAKPGPVAPRRLDAGY